MEWQLRRCSCYNPVLMLTSTFVLLSGIGAVTERRLWHDGVLTWGHFLDAPRIPGLSADRKAWYDRDLALAQARYADADWSYFASRVPSREHWRCFPLMPARTLYLDIETTGGSPQEGEVTVVGLHRRGETVTLVRGENLTAARLQDELDDCALLVTFFGSRFDLPFLRAAFPGLHVTAPHFDLCFAARRLGWRGGLKQIERDLGIDRPQALQGLDGWDAVRLWHAWEHGDTSARDLLLAYNAADTANLEPLAGLIYDGLRERFGPPASPAPAHALPMHHGASA